jgi:excisionase family DNA binding protein
MEPDSPVSVEETPVTSANMPELVKVPAVARYLGISVAQCWRLVWAGEIPSIRLSERVVRVPRDGLVRWLEEKRLVKAG